MCETTPKTESTVQVSGESETDHTDHTGRVADLETTALYPSLPAHRFLRARRFGDARLRRLVVGALLLGLALVLATCMPAQQAHPAPRPTPIPTWMPYATSTPTAVPPLAQVPTNCPVTDAHPQAEFSELHPVMGAVPVWATWHAGPSIFHGAPEEYQSSYGWAMTKTVWEVGPNYSNMVSVRGEDVFDHTPLLFPFGGDTPTATAVLDPKHPGHPVSAVGLGWQEWGSYIMPPKAGCYTMQVSWPTGHWDVTFAFGT